MIETAAEYSARRHAEAVARIAAEERAEVERLRLILRSIRASEPNLNRRRPKGAKVIAAELADPARADCCGAPLGEPEVSAKYCDRHRFGIKRLGVEPSPICEWARRCGAACSRAWRVRNFGRPKLLPCGTHAAYIRHQKRGEAPCSPCVAAYRKFCRESGRLRTRTLRDNPRATRSYDWCGSASSYVRHRRRGERPCAKCRAAHAARIAKYRLAAE